MRLREKGNKGGEPVFMDFGQAQAALQSGAYEMVPEEGEPGPEIHGGVWGNEPAPVEAKTVEGGNAGQLDYEGLSRAELDDLAEERGVDVSHAKTKADVIAALKGR